MCVCCLLTHQEFFKILFLRLQYITIFPSSLSLPKPLHKTLPSLLQTHGFFFHSYRMHIEKRVKLAHTSRPQCAMHIHTYIPKYNLLRPFNVIHTCFQGWLFFALTCQLACSSFPMCHDFSKGEESTWKCHLHHKIHLWSLFSPLTFYWKS